MQKYNLNLCNQSMINVKFKIKKKTTREIVSKVIKDNRACDEKDEENYSKDL